MGMPNNGMVYEGTSQSKMDDFGVPLFQRNIHMAIENPPQLEVLLGKSSMEYVLLPRLIPEGPHHSNHLQLYFTDFPDTCQDFYFSPISMMTTPMHSKCLAEWSRWNGRCDHLQCRFEPPRLGWKVATRKHRSHWGCFKSWDHFLKMSIQKYPKR